LLSQYLPEGTEAVRNKPQSGQPASGRDSNQGPLD